jgi:hypothetical protein
MVKLPVKSFTMKTDPQLPAEPKDLPTTTLKDLVGCAQYKGHARSLEDMEAAIPQGVRTLKSHRP